MRRIQQVYTKIGMGVEAFGKMKPIDPTKYQNLEWPVLQTHGRHNYYDVWTETTLPEHIRWEIRLPKKFAQSEEPRVYHTKVEQEVLNYLNKTIKHNVINPSAPLDLNLTIKEAIVLAEHADALQPHFESGKLKQIHDNFNSSLNNLTATREAVYVALSSIYDKTIEDEKTLNASLKERTGSDHPLCISSNIDTLKDYIKSNPSDTGATALLDQYFGIVNTRALIGEWEVKLLDVFLERGNATSQDFSAKSCIHQNHE